MIIELKIRDDKLVEGFYKKSMKELENFFSIKWIKNRPNIYLLDNRKTIDEIQNKKTEDWLIGFVKGKDVYILDRKNIEKESMHKYSDEFYYELIKHELAHIFFLLITNNCDKPIWLWEGVAIYLSGQYKRKKSTKNLTNFLKYYDKRGKDVYIESGFVVEKLINKYGKSKLIELIKSLKENNSKDDFYKAFKNIYGFNLSYDNINSI